MHWFIGELIYICLPNIKGLKAFWETGQTLDFKESIQIAIIIAKDL